jgi:hypothetical protein
MKMIEFKGFITLADDFGNECFTPDCGEQAMIANVRFFIDGRIEGRDPQAAHSARDDEQALRHFGLIA